MRKFWLYIARHARALAAWADPPVPTVVDHLMPIVRPIVADLEQTDHKGSIKWVLALKSVERQLGKTAVPRLDINDAINRAVRELRSARGD